VRLVFCSLCHLDIVAVISKKKMEEEENPTTQSSSTSSSDDDDDTTINNSLDKELPIKEWCSTVWHPKKYPVLNSLTIDSIIEYTMATYEISGEISLWKTENSKLYEDAELLQHSFQENSLNLNAADIIQHFTIEDKFIEKEEIILFVSFKYFGIKSILWY
jgi:hypothetical protein